MAPESKPRAAVMWFACQMEHKLSLYDRKPCWSADPTWWLYLRLLVEVAELGWALVTGRGVVQEGADCGNFSMMLAERYGQQAPSCCRGRVMPGRDDG